MESSDTLENLSCNFMYWQHLHWQRITILSSALGQSDVLFGYNMKRKQ